MRYRIFWTRYGCDGIAKITAIAVAVAIIKHCTAMKSEYRYPLPFLPWDPDRQWRSCWECLSAAALHSTRVLSPDRLVLKEPQILAILSLCGCDSVKVVKYSSPDLEIRLSSTWYIYVARIALVYLAPIGTSCKQLSKIKSIISDVACDSLCKEVASSMLAESLSNHLCKTLQSKGSHCASRASRIRA